MIKKTIIGDDRIKIGQAFNLAHHEISNRMTIVDDELLIIRTEQLYLALKKAEDNIREKHGKDLEFPDPIKSGTAKAYPGVIQNN